jgi:hypothetical protein
MGTIDALNIELTAELAIQRDELRKTGKVEPGLLIKIVELLGEVVYREDGITGYEGELWNDAWTEQVSKECDDAIAALPGYEKGYMTGRELLEYFNKIMKTLSERPF